jgi:hypothetical protein
VPTIFIYGLSIFIVRSRAKVRTEDLHELKLRKCEVEEVGTSKAGLCFRAQSKINVARFAYNLHKRTKNTAQQEPTGSTIYFQFI